MHILLALIAIEVQPMDYVVQEQRCQHSAGVFIQSNTRWTSLNEVEHAFTQNYDEESFISIDAMVYIRFPLQILDKKAIRRRRCQEYLRRMLNHVGDNEKYQFTWVANEDSSKPYGCREDRKDELEPEVLSEEWNEESLNAVESDEGELCDDVDDDEHHRAIPFPWVVRKWGVNTIENREDKNPYSEIPLQDIVHEELRRVDP